MEGSRNCKLAINFLIFSALATSPSALGQFKKYESKPRFNKANKAAPSAEPSNDAQTFGNRNEPIKLDDKVKSKYVQLNPETAFGPEIVESFDFPDADIMEVTKHMQKLTGINLILDKEASGKKVSISAPNPISVGDAWRAYLAALNMVNLTIVKTGAFYKIINVRDIRYVPTKVYTGSYTPDTEQHVTKVLSIKNVDANEISRNFRPFMSRYGRIIDVKQTNSVIISDTGDNIARLEKLIKFLDVPGFDETLQIIPVANTSAQEIAKLIDEILKDGTSGSTSRRSSSSSSSRFSSKSSQKNKNISKIIAEPRTNSIIAMANAEGAKELKALIGKLDVKAASINSDKIHVHYLNFGNAEELAKTLSSLVSGSAAPARTGGSARNFIPNSNDGSTLFNGEVKVNADKNNNALVVTASATDWLTLKNVIKKLDIPRDQVYVEGMIVETSINKVRSFGTEYYGAYGTGVTQRAGFTSGGGVFDLISSAGTGLSGLFLGGGFGKEVEITPPGATEAIKVNSVNALIKAIATNENSNVLATPQILALDNTEAEFEVGTTVPVLQTTTTTNGTPQTSYVDKEAKLSLKITPQINKTTKYVKLKINQSIDDFRGELNTEGRGAITDTRSAITEIMVKDRDTVAMGGLLRDKETVSVSKVPLLGDIPVLGWLFKSKSKIVEKRNLLFFLTPKIISPGDNVARENTTAKLNERKEHLKSTLTDGQKMPFSKIIKKIRDKNTVPTTESAQVENNSPDYREIANEKVKGI